MTRTRLIFSLLAASILCGGIFLLVSDCTVVPMLANGSGPNGVQVTTGGWAAFLLSLLGTCGFSFSGVAVWIAGHFKFNSLSADSVDTPKTGDQSANQIAELTESFGAFLDERGSKAAQRRFVFALVDAACLIQGVQTSHDNGIVVIKYSGYAETTLVQGGSQI